MIIPSQVLLQAAIVFLSIELYEQKNLLIGDMMYLVF